MKKDHLEVLLENLDSKLDIVVEGHSVLDNKINALDNKLEKSIQENDLAHKALFQMIKEVSHKADNTQKELQEFRQENQADHKKILSRIDRVEDSNNKMEHRVSSLETDVANLRH